MFERVIVPVGMDADRRTSALATAVADWFGLPCEEVGGEPGDVLDIALASSGLPCVADGHHLGPFGPARWLISHAAVPVLVAGPHVDVAAAVPLGQLVVCIAGDDFTARLAAVAADWVERARSATWLLEVTRSGLALADSVEAAPVRRLAADLARRGVDAPWDVVHDDHFAARVLAVTAELPPGVLAVTRADHDRHLPGAANRTVRLVRHAPVPVLVVPPGRRPAHRAGLAGRVSRASRRWAHAA